MIERRGADRFNVEVAKSSYAHDALRIASHKSGSIRGITYIGPDALRETSVTICILYWD